MALQSNDLQTAERYALVLVDLSLGFTDPELSPLASDCPQVVEANRQLLEAFRRRGWPVFFTTVAYDSPDQARVFREKLPSLNVLEAGSRLVEIDPRLAPREGEPVLVKHWASAFFGTDLKAQLDAAGVDGVMVTGLTTSGCVRATAVDALQHDLRVLVPEEAVGDRNQEAHKANLFDLQLKYVDVRPLERCLALLA
ncbi:MULTISPECIES: isochorismatase family protein [Pseudomonadaceae]|uniref:Isochorismatase family hydrolase n=1 Tax=Pseudomonas saudiphocaensis TaxID=1499686 RepID=A0A078LSF3_9PSED|nr:MULTISPECIES: isochorismatase family protein [Pseudomonadaceae]MBE7927833.1 isochorismatase family protein [Pseudomonas saudiphocaensis]MCF6780749.1 isochorismatase family protein [Stutzerimonas stutzeri]MCF6803319.1 isochorismatase family protein [Stutzerimonas stutzeri]CDZ93287.1 isochorismatase family hydrolase [Pseudomonas saudiphocaensis]